MIYGNVNAKETEHAYDPLIVRAINYCRNTKAADIHESKFMPEGEDFKVLFCERVTGPKSEKKAEVHSRMVEIQYCAEGRQSMGYYPDLGCFPVLEDHLNEERDVRFYQNTEDAGEIMLPLYPGQYCVFFPEDVHRPWCTAGTGPEPIKMIVIQIPLSKLSR